MNEAPSKSYGEKAVTSCLMLKVQFNGPTDDEGAEVQVSDVGMNRIRKLDYDYKYHDAHSQAIAYIYKETGIYPLSKCFIEKDRVGLIYPFYTDTGTDVAEVFVEWFKVSTTAGKIKQSYGEAQQNN